MLTLSDFLALSHINGIGPALLNTLETSFPTLSDVFKAPSGQLAKLGVQSASIKALKNPDWEYVERALAWDEHPGNTILTWHDERYPTLLKSASACPPVLYVQGDVELLSMPSIAMVGSRNPSHAGQETASAFSEYLSARGLVVTSGLAYGVDTACHVGALKGIGKTVAVMGTGVDYIYPARNRALAAQIASEGTLVSEFPLGTTPLPANFPRRNRVISGLSLGVLVIEAAKKSGSLITARLASEEGREVFAIPGSIHNPLSKGCHWLIRQGAKLVETADDVLEELGPLISISPSIPKEEAPEVELSAEHTELLKCFDTELIAIDTLVLRSGLTSKEVSSMLLVLEMDEIIESVPGGYVKVLNC